MKSAPEPETDSGSSPSTDSPRHRALWTSTLAAPAGAALALILAAGAVLSGRIELALIAAPVAVAILAVRTRRPPGDDTSAAAATAHLDPVARRIRYLLHIAWPECDLVQVRTEVLGRPVACDLVSAAQARQLGGTIPVLHSGPTSVVRAEYRGVGPDAIVVTGGAPQITARTVIGARIRPLRSLPLPRVLPGVAGGHLSRRLGDGGEFRDIHPFVPGDRLRRIDWKATARRASSAGDLFVRRTTALAEAAIVLVLDSRDDVGERIASWPSGDPVEQGRNSLDLAREAAASLAVAYLAAGDRVGYHDLTRRGPAVTLGSGPRHRSRVLQAIESSEASGTPALGVRAPIVPGGALVYLISSYLDDEPGRLALQWRGAGHRVIAVDVLPPARWERPSNAERLAHRIVLMERADRVRALETGGIEFLAWSGSGSSTALDARLRALERPRRPE